MLAGFKGVQDLKCQSSKAIIQWSNLALRSAFQQANTTDTKPMAKPESFPAIL